MTDPPEDVDENILRRTQGSIIGMALGDALGAHVEFRPQSYLAENPVDDLVGGGTWGLKKGQFTDDTSMALCLAASLIYHRDFNAYDQLVRYKWWYRNGYMSSTGHCFDIGAATSNSLMEFEHRQKRFAKNEGISLSEADFKSDHARPSKFDVYCSEDGVAGNGALMRLTPVPLFFYNHPKEAVELSGISGVITHGDKKAYDACRYYGALIVAALLGEEKEELLDENFYENHKSWFGANKLVPDIMKIAHGSYKKKGGYKAGIRGKGYIVNALEAALWAFWSEDTFQKGVLAAVNLGDDTDTTGAIYGQLAGAYYGYEALPKRWTKQVYAQDFLLRLSKWIVYEGSIWNPSKSKYFDLLLETAPQTQNDDDHKYKDHSSENETLPPQTNAAAKQANTQSKQKMDRKISAGSKPAQMLRTTGQTNDDDDDVKSSPENSIPDSSSTVDNTSSNESPRSIPSKSISSSEKLAHPIQSDSPDENTNSPVSKKQKSEGSTEDAPSEGRQKIKKPTEGNPADTNIPVPASKSSLRTTKSETSLANKKSNVTDRPRSNDAETTQASAATNTRAPDRRQTRIVALPPGSQATSASNTNKGKKNDPKKKS